MRLPHPTHLLVRDYFVIVAHRAALEQLEETPPGIVMHLTEEELHGDQPTPEDDLVPVPYYEMESGGEEESDTFRFVDPPFTGPVLPYPEVLERQVRFLCLLAVESLRKEVSGKEPALGLLARTVAERRADKGTISAKVLAQILYEHRWSPGPRLTADLFDEALLAPSVDWEQAAAQLHADAARPRFFEARLEGVRSRFEDANQKATSLTDWAEQLYRLRPHLDELTRYLKVSKLEGSERQRAYVSYLNRTVDRSLHALGRLAEATVLGSEEAPLYFDAELESARLEGNARSLATLLDELYLHRRSLPRFWYEAARESLGNVADQDSPVLRDIDPYRMISIRCLEEWSHHWQIKTKVLQAMDVRRALAPELAEEFELEIRPPGPATRDPGPPPHPSRVRRRDYEIIRAGVEHFSLPEMEQPWPLWTAMLEAKPDLEALSLEDDLVNVPRVRGRYNEETGRVFGYSNDPPWTGETESYLDTMAAQAAFFRRMATRHQIDVTRREDQRSAYLALSDIVWDEGEMHGAEYVRGLVDRWHAHRWAPGGRLTGMLLYQCMTDPHREDSLRTDERIQIENNGTLINERIKTAQRRLDEAKESVRSLTEWAEALYRIHPYVQEVILLLEVSEGANAEAWRKRFLGVSDQIIETTTLNCNAVIRSASGAAHFPTWTTTYLDDLRKEEGGVKQIWERLEHLYRKQVAFPRFWYELALEHLDTPVEKMPAALTAIDALRATSIDVLECWSAQLMWTLRELQERAEAGGT